MHRAKNTKAASEIGPLNFENRPVWRNPLKYLLQIHFLMLIYFDELIDEVTSSKVDFKLNYITN